MHTFISSRLSHETIQYGSLFTDYLSDTSWKYAKITLVAISIIGALATLIYFYRSYHAKKLEPEESTVPSHISPKSTDGKPAEEKGKSEAEEKAKSEKPKEGLKAEETAPAEQEIDDEKLALQLLEEEVNLREQENVAKQLQFELNQDLSDLDKKDVIPPKPDPASMPAPMRMPAPMPMPRPAPVPFRPMPLGLSKEEHENLKLTLELLDKDYESLGLDQDKDPPSGPIPTPASDPVLAPVPTPTPALDPVLTPVPTPTPALDPVLTPVPTPTPALDPVLTPVPTPTLTPDPVLAPIPTPTKVTIPLLPIPVTLHAAAARVSPPLSTDEMTQIEKILAEISDKIFRDSSFSCSQAIQTLPRGISLKVLGSLNEIIVEFEIRYSISKPHAYRAPIPSYSNDPTISDQQRKYLSLVGFRNLFLYGPSFLGNFCKQWFLGGEHHDESGKGLKKFPSFLGHVVHLDSPIEAKDDVEAINMARDMIIKFGRTCGLTKPNLTAKDVAEAFPNRKLELDDSIVPEAKMDTECANHGLWKRVNTEGKTEYFVNVPDCENVLIATLELPYLLAKLVHLTKEKNAGKLPKEFFDEFFDKGISDKDFNDKAHTFMKFYNDWKAKLGE